MNRIVLFGLTSFFAFIGLCLIEGPKQAKAFHGWPIYGGCSCQGWHPWYANQRCYSSSGCSGCYGCYATARQCCGSSCHSYAGHQKCYGCYGNYGCQGVIYQSCQGCYGSCSGYGGYYQGVVTAIVVPFETPPAVSPAANAIDEKTTLQIQPAADSDLGDSADDNTIRLSSYPLDGVAQDLYIREPQ